MVERPLAHSTTSHSTQGVRDPLAFVGMEEDNELRIVVLPDALFWAIVSPFPWNRSCMTGRCFPLGAE